jgi:opacity protein-like surface antigen
MTASGPSSTASLSNHLALAVTADVGTPESSQQYELFYSREETGLRLNSTVRLADVTLEYLHLGGTVLFDDDAKIKPYAAGGLGITRFTPSDGGSTDTKFSMSLGLGLKWPVTRRFSLRLEARGFVTVVDSDTSSLCRSGQSGLACRIHGNGQAFVQGQLLAGATLAF